MDIHTTLIEQREYYHYSYRELCREKGEELALGKVKESQQLAKQNEYCDRFILHRCQLLKTCPNLHDSN